MITRSYFHKIVASLFALFIFSAITFQMYHTVNDNVRHQRMPIWRMRNSTSFERSAVFLLTPRGAEFLKFIQDVIPPGSKVTIPLFAGPFSEQSVMQFFMMDRSIFGCPRVNQIECLSKPDKYLIATFKYPPDESDINKTLEVFPEINELYPYKGVYLADNYVRGNYGALYPEKYNIPLTILCDLGILLAWFLIGWAILVIVSGKHYHPLTLIPAFPVGMGVFTWCLFLTCLAGAPLTLLTLVIVYLIMLIPLGILTLRMHCLPPGLLELFHNLRSEVKQIRFSFFSLSIILLIFLFILFLVYITVGRGYSTFDDIAIWSLKGYYMAYKNDLFAAGQASGHSLSYPLNLPLAISTFYLADMDLLPGSKLAYLLLFITMLGCIYWFFRKNHVSQLFTLLGILLIISTPVMFDFATLGFANMPFACYLVIGTILGIHGVTNNQTRYLYLSGVVLSLAGWTRPEGIGYALFIAIAIGIFGFIHRIRLSTFLLYVFTSVSLCGIWMLLGYRYIQGDEIGQALRSLYEAIATGTFSFNIIKTTLAYSWNSLITLRNWGVVIPLCVIILASLSPVILRRKNTNTLIMTVLALGTFLIPQLMFVTKSFQSNDYLGFLYVSFDRAQIPAVILLILSTILSTKCLYPPIKTSGEE